MNPIGQGDLSKPYPQSLRMWYPADYQLKQPILYTLDHPEGPRFFYGLGTPWKIGPDAQFAIIIKNSHQQNFVAGGLKRDFGFNWHLMELKDAILQADSCETCGTGWSAQEKEYALAAATLTTATGAAFIPLTSPIHTYLFTEEPIPSDILQNVADSTKCTDCRNTICGAKDCRPPKRGRGSGLCQTCRKKKNNNRSRR